MTGTQAVFQNAGTCRKSAGTGTTVVNFGITFTNAGVVEALSGALNLEGPFTNYANTTLTGGTYLVVTTPRFDRANVAPTAANLVVDGPASQLLTLPGGNALANFPFNTAPASFRLDNGRSLAISAAFRNAGSLTIGIGSTFAADTTYTQTAGTTTL